MTSTLTPQTFDALVKPSRIIWTLPAIAHRMGVGPDFVRDTIVPLPGSPVRRIGRRWYAMEEELMAFMRGAG